MKQLMQFKGMVNFYHRFLSQAARMMSPLYDAVAGNSPGKTASEKNRWSEQPRGSGHSKPSRRTL